MLAPSGDPLPNRSSSAPGVRGTESRVARGGDGLLLTEVHLRFANVDSRPIRVRRAGQVPQGRVPRGVHGEAR